MSCPRKKAKAYKRYKGRNYYSFIVDVVGIANWLDACFGSAATCSHRAADVPCTALSPYAPYIRPVSSAKVAKNRNTCTLSDVLPQGCH